MNFDEYEQCVARTGKMDEGIEAAKKLGAIGLCGEASEVFFAVMSWESTRTSSILSELGDVLWCVAYTARAYKISLASIAKAEAVGSKQPEQWLMFRAGRVAELVKKDVYHGRDVTKTDVALALGEVFCLVRQIGDQYGFTLEQLMIENNEKLLKRYPDGFSKEAARKLDASK
jgi:NTP pyrophosphatase (non-canonical NTP hydrolase)